MTDHHHLVDSKKKFVLLILVLGCIIALGPMSIDMYLPAFSMISDSFAASKEKVQLSLTSYFVGMAVSQLFYGPIIDRFGRRIPLFFGLFINFITRLILA